MFPLCVQWNHHMSSIYPIDHHMSSHPCQVVSTLCPQGGTTRATDKSVCCTSRWCIAPFHHLPVTLVFPVSCYQVHFAYFHHGINALLKYSTQTSQSSPVALIFRSCPPCLFFFPKPGVSGDEILRTINISLRKRCIFSFGRMIQGWLHCGDRVREDRG